MRRFHSPAAKRKSAAKKARLIHLAEHLQGAQVPRRPPVTQPEEEHACEFCGRPLRSQRSIERGAGDACALRAYEEQRLEALKMDRDARRRTVNGQGGAR
ncbi:MAG: hypothetical protein HY900_34680 [Deltaproteobacteria bacterium]|nr:hypothetical protein [Deltaproteobacteria bacterium]